MAVRYFWLLLLISHSPFRPVTLVTRGTGRIGTWTSAFYFMEGSWRRQSRGSRWIISMRLNRCLSAACVVCHGCYRCPLPAQAERL